MKTLPRSEVVLFDEPGRIIREGTAGATDYRSHSFTVAQPEFGQLILRVEHGAGVEEIPFGYPSDLIHAAFSGMTSDQRFRFLAEIFWQFRKAREIAVERCNAEWTQAAGEGRIQTRKVRGQNAVRVRLLPKMEKLAESASGKGLRPYPVKVDPNSLPIICDDVEENR